MDKTVRDELGRIKVLEKNTKSIKSPNNNRYIKIINPSHEYYDCNFHVECTSTTAFGRENVLHVT